MNASDLCAFNLYGQVEDVVQMATDGGRSPTNDSIAGWKDECWCLELVGVLMRMVLKGA